VIAKVRPSRNHVVSQGIGGIMPTYDYKCDACGHRFEKFQSITAAPVRKCPACGKNKVKRLLGTGAGVIFKGSGFYTTDYRSESYKSGAKAEGGTTGADGKAGGDSKSTGEGKAAAETKPAAAKESPGKSSGKGTDSSAGK
jgi:putative FmdB family regulatory protein